MQTYFKQENMHKNYKNKEKENLRWRLKRGDKNGTESKDLGKVNNKVRYADVIWSLGRILLYSKTAIQLTRFSRVSI